MNRVQPKLFFTEVYIYIFIYLFIYLFIVGVYNLHSYFPILNCVYITYFTKESNMNNIDRLYLTAYVKKSGI